MKIANIVHEKDLVNHTKVDYINYFNEPIEYDKLDKTLPTLYVGWSFMKATNPSNEIIQNANILHKKIIGNELYWECSFEESKASHIKGVESFINAAPQFYFQPKYQYINLDPVFFQLKDIQDFTDVIPKKIDGSYCLKNEMLYILASDEKTGNKIYGINLNMYGFFKFDTEEILQKIHERAEIKYVDPEGTFYQEQYKIFPNFNNLKRYLVVMLSK